MSFFHLNLNSFRSLSLFSSRLFLFRKSTQLRVGEFFAHFCYEEMSAEMGLICGSESGNGGTWCPFDFCQISILCEEMSVDLSILARGIPLDPLPELYSFFVCFIT